MPLMKRPRKIDPERVYLARDGFADATGSVRRGERLRGSHRMVREHPSMWIEDVSDAELAHMPEPRVAAPAVHHEPNTILPKQLGPEEPRRRREEPRCEPGHLR